MRKLIGAGLAALLLAVAIPSHADALGGRGGGRRRAAKSSSSSSGSSWAQPKASGKRSGSKKGKKGGVGIASGLPAVSLPDGAGGGGRRRAGGGGRAKPTRTAPAIVDYNAQAARSGKKVKLDNGGLGGSPEKHGGGGGKKHGGGKHKKG